MTRKKSYEIFYLHVVFSMKSIVVKLHVEIKIMTILHDENWPSSSSKVLARYTQNDSKQTQLDTHKIARLDYRAEKYPAEKSPFSSWVERKCFVHKICINLNF